MKTYLFVIKIFLVLFLVCSIFYIKNNTSVEVSTGRNINSSILNIVENIYYEKNN